MVNKAQPYNPTPFTDAFEKAMSSKITFDEDVDETNAKKAVYFSKANHHPATFQFANSRSINSHPEFDTMNIENAINPNDSYDIVKFEIQDYSYQKIVNEEQFSQSLLHAVHLSQHCQIIPSSFQSLNTTIRDVIKRWSNGDIENETGLVANRFNVITYKNQTFDFNQFSRKTQILLDEEMRMISISIYNAFLRQSDATGFTAMIPTKVMDIVMQEMFIQTPNEISAGSFVKTITESIYPVRIIDTYEFDIPCRKHNPVVRFVSNYDFHPMWTYPVKSMLTASQKRSLYSIYLSCEQRKAFKKAAELGVITFKPLMEHFLLPQQRNKRHAFTLRDHLCLKDIKVFQKDNFLTDKSDVDIVFSYIFASYSLDPNQHTNDRSARFEDEQSRVNYGGVKSKKFKEYVESILTAEELHRYDLEHQKTHHDVLHDTGKAITCVKLKSNSCDEVYDEHEEDILINNNTEPVVYANLTSEQVCVPFCEISDLFNYINGFSIPGHVPKSPKRTKKAKKTKSPTKSKSLSMSTTLVETLSSIECNINDTVPMSPDWDEVLNTVSSKLDKVVARSTPKKVTKPRKERNEIPTTMNPADLIINPENHMHIFSQSFDGNYYFPTPEWCESLPSSENITFGRSFTSSEALSFTSGAKNSSKLEKTIENFDISLYLSLNETPEQDLLAHANKKNRISANGTNSITDVHSGTDSTSAKNVPVVKQQEGVVITEEDLEFLDEFLFKE